MHDVVDRSEWEAASAALRDREKALTRELDVLAAQRRRLPATEVDRGYRFVSPAGERSLVDLFEGRPQLIVYHHMLAPGDDDPCAGCCMFSDHLPPLDHLHARDVSVAVTSRAPIAEIEAFRTRMDWRFPWYEEDGTFADAMGVDGFQLDVLLHDTSGGRDRVLRTYSTSGRGVESLGSTWTFLDLTPYGRQETWQDTPDGRPQSEPYVWWRRRGEYPGPDRV